MCLYESESKRPSKDGVKQLKAVTQIDRKIERGPRFSSFFSPSGGRGVEERERLVA